MAPPAQSCATLLVLLTCACSQAPPTGGDDDTTEEPTPDPGGGGELLLGEPVTCSDPVSGFARLTEEAALRGVTPDLTFHDGPTPCLEVLGEVVSSDLDLDGDADLLFHNRDGFPQVFENDGSGQFSLHPVDLDVRGVWDRSVLSYAALDLDGDRLPEVVLTGPSLVLMARNLGGLEFADFEVLYDEPAYPRGCFNTQTWGDVDADGDLDLLLPTIDPVVDGDTLLDWDPESAMPDDWAPTTDPLLINREGVFEEVARLGLGPNGEAGLSILGAFTDRDNDGDLDLLIFADRAAGPPNPPTAFFRHDGPDADDNPILVNDAAQIGAALPTNGMGFGSGDINGDGYMDYCISDIQPFLMCMVSDGVGGYFEAGAALGLTIEAAAPTTEGDPTDWSGWSLEYVDLDNDGWADWATSAGGAGGTFFSDAIWQGVPGGTFVERTSEVGFGDMDSHFGMAADDFDGDGYVDLVLSGWTGDARFWSNPCGAESWIEIEMIGAGLNTEAFGARVEVEWADRREMREVHALRTLGQSTSRVHVGLGDSETVDTLLVRWPGGDAVTVFEDVPARRVVTVVHPDAER